MELSHEKKLKYFRVGCLAAIKFWLMVTYAIVRPATSSLFLETHSSDDLPIAWILVAAGMVAAVYLYNRFVAKTDLIKLLGWISFISAAALIVLLAACSQNMPGSYYALYMWKDIHVVILVEVLYSFASAVFPIRTARWVYGLFGAMGAFGAIVGNLAVGPLAERFGTFNTLFIVPPMLIVVWLAALPFAKHAGIGSPLKGLLDSSEIRKTVEIIRRSPYLFLLLLLIPTIQIVMTLVDFEFQTVLQNNFSDVDVRTGVFGRIYAMISFSTITTNLLMGPALRLIGVPIALFAVPLLLGAGVGVFAAIPRFIIISIVKIASKTFDYTFLRASKEILYIPLSYAEKTVGKSVIDMLGYRVAKGIASAMLLVLIALGIQSFASWLTLAMIAVWTVIVSLIVFRFRHLVSRDKEMYSDQVGSGAMTDLPEES